MSEISRVGSAALGMTYAVLGMIVMTGVGAAMARWLM